MSLYTDYLSEIETRKKEGLKPKPIEDGKLLKEIILQIKDTNNNHRKESINFFKLELISFNSLFNSFIFANSTSS